MIQISYAWARSFSTQVGWLENCQEIQQDVFLQRSLNVFHKRYFLTKDVLLPFPCLCIRPHLPGKTCMNATTCLECKNQHYLTHASGFASLSISFGHAKNLGTRPVSRAFARHDETLDFGRISWISRLSHSRCLGFWTHWSCLGTWLRTSSVRRSVPVVTMGWRATAGRMVSVPWMVLVGYSAAAPLDLMLIFHF